MTKAFNFGSLNLERPALSTKDGFWLTAKREGFTALCIRQYYDHMNGSFGDKAVNGSCVVGYIEAPGKRKGAQ